jgi:hypothetical protein
VGAGVVQAYTALHDFPRQGNYEGAYYGQQQRGRKDQPDPDQTCRDDRTKSHIFQESHNILSFYRVAPITALLFLALEHETISPSSEGIVLLAFLSLCPHLDDPIRDDFLQDPHP